MGIEVKQLIVKSEIVEDDKEKTVSGDCGGQDTGQSQPVQDWKEWVLDRESERRER